MEAKRDVGRGPLVAPSLAFQKTGRSVASIPTRLLCPLSWESQVLPLACLPDERSGNHDDRRIAQPKRKPHKNRRQYEKKIYYGW
jgi:hypothetical protein